jgi:hypothetical protein
MRAAIEYRYTADIFSGKLIQYLCLKATFEKLENETREVNANEEMLKKNYLELTELKHILRKTQNFFEEVNLFILFN